MGININLLELSQVLKMTPAHQNIMLVGKHGIGKSRVICDYFKDKEERVVSLFLGQMSDPGDLIGLLYKDENSGKTDFLPPYWFPTDNRPIVLFLDELNRARPEILQTIMDLTLNKTLAGKSLPNGSRIISAVNEGDEYQLSDLDPALVSRFNIYHFKPSVSEWLLWAAQNGIDQRILSFIQDQPDFLDTPDPGLMETGFDKAPDRRAWERVSEIIKGLDSVNQISKKVIAGVIGVKSAAQFYESIGKNKLLSGKEILKNFKKILSILETYQLNQMALVNESIFRILELEGSNPEPDISLIRGLESYLSWLNYAEKSEVLAHWATIFESTAYPKSNLMVMRNMSPKHYDSITEFIRNLKNG